MKKLLQAFVWGLLLFVQQNVLAQACQTSNAGAATYNSGWSNGSNDNSTGFGNWILTNGGGSSGHFVFTSNNNDAGAPGLPNIDAGGRSWGLFARDNQTADATRPFVTAMAIGHSISFSTDNGSLQSGSSAGFSLRNAAGQNLMEVYFRGGASNYEYNDAGGVNVSTGVSFTRGGLDIKITRTGTSTYNISITRKENNAVVTASRTFSTPANGNFTPGQIRFFNFNSGNGADFNFYCNNLNLCRPTISSTGSLSGLTTTYGTASSNTSFNVSGTEMLDGITVTAPTGFQVSTNATSGFVNSIVVGTGGTIASTPVFVRLAATTAVNSYSGNIVLSSTGATSVNVATVSSTVNPAALTITGVTANNRSYNGLTTATLSGTAAYSGLQNGESFSVSGTPSANFNNASVGNGKPVTVSGYTAPSGNYTVSQPTGLTADITTAALTITGVSANNKTFDGNTTATLSGTPQYNGLQNGESFSVTGTPIANFNNAAVGNNKPVTVSGYTAPTGNYTVSQPTGLTANILALSQSTADFRSNGSGDFSSAAIWQYDQGGDDWQIATQSPSINNNVLIRNGHNITLDVNYIVGLGKDFDLSPTSSLTINPTATLTIAGNADFAGQSVTLKSSVAGTGAIGQITGGLANATNVTIERFIPASGSRAWRLLSVPTKGAQTIRQSWQDLSNGDAALTNNNPGIGTQITTTGANAAAVAAGFDNNSPAASMLTYSPANNTWTGVPTTNAAIENKDGYFLFVRGAREQGVSGATNQTSPTTLRTTGELYTGSQTSNAIPDGKFGLVGNIYPSRIDFTQLTRTNVGNTFYLWDAKKVVGNKLGAYVTFSGTNGFVPSLLGGSFNSSTPNPTIESGQSFFVAASGGTGTIGFNEDDKTSATPGNGSFTNAFRPAAPATSATNLVSLSTSLYIGTTIADANEVVFDNQYSNAIDANDALKLANPGENLAIWRFNQNLVVEGRQAIIEKDTIAFRMWNLSQRTYQLRLQPSNLSIPGLTAVLQDTYTNTNTPLSLNAVNNYNFVVDANAASANPTRFRVLFVKPAGAPLPVNFVNITAERNAAVTQIKWTVAAERGVVRYEVERSTDGRNFSISGTVQATASSASEKTYRFEDTRAFAGTAFYRIRSIDADGSSKYSAIVKVSADSKAGYTVLGNPTSGNNIAVLFSAQKEGRYTMRLTNAAGQLLTVKVINHTSGAATHSIKANGLTNGAYTIQIFEPSGKMQSLPVWINNAE